MNQLPMTFTPHVRGSDTSRDAALSIEPHMTKLQERVLSYIHRSEGCTDEQGAIGTNLNPSTYRPRRIELADQGRIRADGTRRTASGRLAQVWRVV